MKTNTLLYLPILLLGSADAAALQERTTPKPTGCAVITGALSVLKSLQGPATTFCSSYLHLSAGTTATTTVISTVTATTTGATVYTTYTGTTPPAKKKRNATPNNTPSKLTQYPPASISSACSCLGLKGGTATTTTVTSTTTTTTAATATQTVCVAPGAYCSFAPGAAPCCPGYACAAFSDGSFCFEE